MDTALLVTLVLLNLGLLGALIALLRKGFQPSVEPETLSELSSQLSKIDVSISQGLRSVTADMAARLEGTKGDLRQQVTDRLARGFQEIRESVEG